MNSSPAGKLLLLSGDVAEFLLGVFFVSFSLPTYFVALVVSG